MDIVKSNFETQSSLFFKDIEKTEFFAIDLEFTGIKTDERTSRTDTCSQRYKKCYQVAKRYQIIQFGISKFVKTDTDKYDCSTYNFYVFPSSFNEKFDSYFKCDVSTIEFLVNCNSIDFNKWINEGIPYFNSDQLEKIRKNLTRDVIQEIINNGVKKPTQFNVLEEREQAQVDWENIKAWIQNDDCKDPMIYENENFQFKKFILENFLKEFSDQKKNFFFEEFYSPFIQKRYLKIFKVNGEQHEQKLKEKQTLIEDEINSTRGFGNFWEKLTQKIQEYNIPVVGHNMYLDLLFIVNHFENFITEDYIQYKKTLRNMFPIIYDTKILQNNLKLKNGQGLEQIYKYFEQRYAIEIIDKNKSLESGVAHNAGYDAYMTGACFLFFQKELETKKFQNLIKLYGHPYIAMKNGSKSDALLVEKVYVIGFKEKKTEKNKKTSIQKIFKDIYTNNKLQLSISEKRIISNKNNSAYILYIEELGNLTEEDQKLLKKTLVAIGQEFTDLITYEEFDELVYDQIKSKVQLIQEYYIQIRQKIKIFITISWKISK